MVSQCRARWVEEGEKPTKYFCNLESRNFINKTIKRVDDGHTTFHEQFEILNQVKSFYEALYLDKDAEFFLINGNKGKYRSDNRQNKWTPNTKRREDVPKTEEGKSEKEISKQPKRKLAQKPDEIKTEKRPPIKKLTS